MFGSKSYIVRICFDYISYFNYYPRAFQSEHKVAF